MLVNDNPQSFFELEKSIRQEDPLSPFLFIILAKVLRRLISIKRNRGLWKGGKMVRGVQAISHLEFLDEIFLIGEASKQEAKMMKRTLELYGKVLG